MVPQLISSFHFGPISLKIITLVPQLFLRYSILVTFVSFLMSKIFDLILTI